MADDGFRTRLDALCRRALGGPLAAVDRLSGGASQELWSFDVNDAEATRGFVLRRSPGGGPERTSACGLATEAAVITAAGRAGVPVATVAHVLAPEDGLGPGFVAERVGGEALGRRIVRDDAFAAVRPRLAAECGAILARIHATPLGALPPLQRRTPAEAVEGLRALLAATGQARPVAELALRWLAERAPPAGALTLVHGDFRTGNFLLEPTGVRAVLDWEGVHLGDPMSDLGWLCAPAWRFGVRDRPVGGFGAREDLFAGYEQACGRPVDSEAVRFWEVFAMLRWSLICVGFGAEFTTGADPSVERGAIGRRASESEYDLMEALAPAPEAGRLMQDAPSPAELVEAAARFLRETATPALAGQAAFHARVAAGALEIAARQMRFDDPGPELASLRALLGEDGDLEALNRRLAERIAQGTLTLETPGLAEHLWRVTLAKLAVDQPRYAATPATRTDP